MVSFKTRARIWLLASVSLLTVACSTVNDYSICDDGNSACPDNTVNNIVVE